MFKNAYAELKTEYFELLETGGLCSHNPPKFVIALAKKDGIITNSKSILTAMNRNGDKVVKHITIDDISGDESEEIWLQLKGDKTQALINKGLTPIRCGLMTCLAIERFMNFVPGMKVGYVGCGKTNLANCRAIKELFGEHKAIVRGSSWNISKNIEVFAEIAGEAMCDDSDGMEELNKCDVVITCTSSVSQSEQIHRETLKDVKLIIALDCGYLLAEDFREHSESYTDHKLQIESHFSDEFPFDKKQHKFKSMSDSDMADGKQKVVYLFGIGLADLVTAKHYVKGGFDE